MFGAKDDASLFHLVASPHAAWMLAGLMIPATALLSLRTRRGARPTCLPLPPIDASARFHLATAPEPQAIAHAATLLARRLLQGGGRVLLVDGGRRLDLHAFFGCVAQWGVGECVRGELPLLGVVQRTECPGLYLLARGALRSAEDWPGLGRVLEAARSRFDHVILALDPRAPREAAAALSGATIAGAFGCSGAVPRTGLAFGERLRIPLMPLVLRGSFQAALEALIEAAVETRPEPAPPDPSGASRAWIASRTHTVLDCDLRVRERMRFAYWLRSIAVDRRARAAAPRPAPKLAEREQVETAGVR